MRYRQGNADLFWLGAIFGALLWVLPAVAVAGSPQMETAQASIDASPEAQQRWAESLAMAQEGRFTAAHQAFRKLVSQGVSDQRVRQVDSWLSQYQVLQNARRTRIGEQFSTYVSWVKGDLANYREDGERCWWRNIMGNLAVAYQYAEDQDGFSHEPWVLDLAREALEVAQAYERDHEWLEAARIYLPLTELYRRNPTYRESLRRCQEHIRLDIMYTADSEWEQSISHVVPEMARDAFRKINDEYLRPPDFKAATIAGIEQVLRITEHPKLAEVFESLDKTSLKTEFVTRVKANLVQVRDRRKVTTNDLIERFNRLLQINRELKFLPENLIIYEFTHGALQPLDRFSDVLWPSDIMEFNKHTQGRFSGVGISIRKAAGEPIKVISPLKDTPAYRKGIRPGDMITKVDGDPTEKISITEAVRRITGPTGTTVTLTIERPGREMPFDVELVRQEIIIYTVKGHQRQDNGEWDFMIDPERKIGYVRMTNFTENTIDEMKNVIHRLRVQRGMRGLIFDLRGNPGGPLKAAIEVTDLFLDGEHRIVSTKDRHGSPWVKSSTDDAHFTGFPLIILADDSSASASEIVTGALQIHGRALVVGERTYGKGSVQQVIGLNNTNRAYLKLTTALYYLPNDRCLHREDDSEMWGVDPDIEVRLVPKEFIKMKTLQLKDDILKGKDQDALTEDQIRDVTEYGRSNDDDEEDQDEPREDKAEVAEEADDEMDACQATLEELDRDDENNFPEVDPQLETALMLMRIRLESQFPWSHETTTVAASPIGSTDG